MNQAASERKVLLVKAAFDLSIDPDFYKYIKGHPGPGNAKIIAKSLFEQIVGFEVIEEK